MYYVYKHTAPNGKVYIGITSRNPKKRWNSGYGYEGNEYFRAAIKKYGWDNIKHEILLEGLTQEQAYQKENELIAEYDSTNREKGYNISLGGGQVSEETRRKIGEANKGKHLTEETRRKIGEATKQKWENEEYRRKISEANKGKHHTEETRRKMSEANKGERNPNYGKPAHNRKKVECIETNKIYSSLTEAATKTNMSRGYIREVCNGKRKTAGGYHWQYIE